MPRIVYLSWPAHEISGGIKCAFQHVEMLVAAGLDAVVATPDGARPTWFATTAPVIAQSAIGTGDALVFPENNAPFLEAHAASSQPKFVFLQNPYQACQGLVGRRSYRDYGVSHVLAPSMSVVRYCALRFPELPVAYTPFCVDGERFAFRRDKALQVAVIPRKRMTEFAAIADLLPARFPEFAGVKWLYMNGASEQEVAAAMGASAVFLSLARLEAHSMTTLEAMACGCVVAGFTGVFGGSDSATLRNGFWAAEDDVIGCVEQLGRALRLARDCGAALALVQDEGRATAQQYSREESARRLVAFWRAYSPST